MNVRPGYPNTGQQQHLKKQIVFLYFLLELQTGVTIFAFCYSFVVIRSELSASSEVERNWSNPLSVQLLRTEIDLTLRNNIA
jgi:hypothetical protein